MIGRREIQTNIDGKTDNVLVVKVKKKSNAVKPILKQKDITTKLRFTLCFSIPSNLANTQPNKKNETIIDKPKEISIEVLGKKLNTKRTKEQPSKK